VPVAQVHAQQRPGNNRSRPSKEGTR
jgi:hypothetical protein